MFYDYVRALLGSPQALKNTKLKLLKQQSSLHLTHFYNKDIPRHVRTGEWPYIYGQKINSLPIWICGWNKGISLPKRYILTAQNSCEVGYTSCNLWPSTSTDRSRNGRLVQPQVFTTRNGRLFLALCSAVLKRRWTYPDLRSDEEKYSKYHHDMTIWTHFRTNS